MAHIVARSIALFIVFLQQAWGSVHTPYETYRYLAKGERLGLVIPIFLLCAAYFAWSSLVHLGLSSHPYQLTFSFGKLAIAAAITYIVVLVSLRGVGSLVGGTGTLKHIMLPWTYSLIPTVLWFFTTSVMMLVFPPPRTESFLGQTFSFLFVSFSLFLFFWKGILYYLTLRFGMRLSMGRIMVASLILFPLGALYAVVMYMLGIFRIPFI